MPSEVLEPKLDDYGLIGNLHTAALVSRKGAIDWACLPRFAAPSVFARLIGGSEGGYSSLAPAEAFRSTQRYRPSSCILETRFELSGGRSLTVTDAMPIVSRHLSEGAPMILRAAHAEGGPVGIEVHFDPRFDYGRRPARYRIIAEGVEASSQQDLLRCATVWPFSLEGGRAVARGTLAESDRLEVELIWGGSRPVTDSFSALVDGAERFWREWVHDSSAPLHRLAHPWHRWVERSELTLKLLAHADTGAFVAAPTTSLPEWPGAGRNWDYRYAWIRDAAFSAQSLLHLNHFSEARAFLRWAVLRVRSDPNRILRVVYGTHGETDLTESTLDHFEGLWGSRPVRIGNAAAEQFQLDIYGELLDAALLLERFDREFVEAEWEDLSGLADQVVRLWRNPDRGIWEVRGPSRQYVHSKLMSWVALDRAVRLGRRVGEVHRLDGWASEAEQIRRWLETDGVDPKTGAFRQSAEVAAPDAANLRIPLVGFLPHDDPRVMATVEQVRRELTDGPFVYRYRDPDGLLGPEGAFLPCSFWMVECLARAGRGSEARAAWEGLLAAATPLDLYSEEFDPQRGLRLGNFPQALSHIGILRATLALGELGVRESVGETKPKLPRRARRTGAPGAQRPSTRARSDRGAVRL